MVVQKQKKLGPGWPQASFCQETDMECPFLHYFISTHSLRGTWAKTFFLIPSISTQVWQSFSAQITEFQVLQFCACYVSNKYLSIHTTGSTYLHDLFSIFYCQGNINMCFFECDKVILKSSAVIRKILIAKVEKHLSSFNWFGKADNRC